jgi:hypothetical protein
MQKNIFYLFIFFSICTLGYFTSTLFYINEKDIENYHQIMDRKTKSTSCQNLKRQPLYQERQGVQKDIFLSQNKTRNHFKIQSEESCVTFTEKNEKIELIENLKNIKCLIQDKIIDENNSFTQQLRYFTAKKGTYVYPSHKFVSDAINLSFFDIPGKSLPETINDFNPYLKGFAKEVYFSLTDKTPQLTAYHFRASFDF